MKKTDGGLKWETDWEMVGRMKYCKSQDVFNIVLESSFNVKISFDL